MNRIDVLCSSCKRRYAIYRRRSSGELLCRLCLFRSLIKQTRKAIHYYQMMRRGGSALYIVRPDALGEAVVGFLVYRNSIKDFESNVYALCIDGIARCQDIEKFFDGKVDKYLKISTRYTPLNKIEMVKFFEALAVKIARKIGVEFVVSPLFRDELALFLVAGILTTSRALFSEGLPVKIVNGIKIVRPFFYVISIDMVVMKILGNMVLEPQIELRCEEFMRKAKSMLYSSMELMYSSVKTIELFETYVFGSSSKCVYCGAFSVDGICEICKKFHQHVDAIE